MGRPWNGGWNQSRPAGRLRSRSDKVVRTRYLQVVFGLGWLTACTTPLGSIGLLASSSEIIGLKILQPRVVGRSCRSSVFGIPLDAGTPDLGEALAKASAGDAEGNVVANAEIRSESTVTGVYNRRCIEVSGDLARTTTLIRVPTSHSGHH